MPLCSHSAGMTKYCESWLIFADEIFQAAPLVNSRGRVSSAPGRSARQELGSLPISAADEAAVVAPCDRPHYSEVETSSETSFERQLRLDLGQTGNERTRLVAQSLIDLSRSSLTLISQQYTRGERAETDNAPDPASGIPVYRHVPVCSGSVALGGKDSAAIYRPFPLIQRTSNTL